MDSKLLVKGLVVGLVLGALAGWWLGDSRGYKRAEANLKKVQGQAAEKATAEAAKAANPFQAVNPLEKVEANPFEKAKSIVNPFK